MNMRTLLGAVLGMGMSLIVLVGCAESGEAAPDRAAQERATPKATVECDGVLIDRLLTVVEDDIVPLTQAGVRSGNKVFGAAILRKSDLSVVVASTNTETENPLWHGEVHTLKRLYEMPRSERPAPKDCIFLATHEPCPLCLSAITWGGYDNFYFLFSYEDSRDSFNIPHDLRLLKEVFKQDAGGYAHANYYWTCYDIVDMIRACDAGRRDDFLARVDALQKTYAEMSVVYQNNKDDSDIPLK